MWKLAAMAAKARPISYSPDRAARALPTERPITVTDPRSNAEHPANARDWSRVLTRYRAPDPARSVLELIVTLAPFLATWAVAWWLLSYSTALAMLFALGNAAFLVRLFMIQHDCGHGSFFRSKRLCNWLGRAIGVVTLTPYDVWRETHAIHHATTGNLDRRGIGDMPTLTVAEYRAKGPVGRGLYRLVRHPLFLFGVVPFYSFFLQNRLPVGLMRSGWRYWLSAMATNAAIAAVLTALVWFGGWNVVLFIFFPTMLLAASTGMWFFYVQHQFEHTSWKSEADWDVQDAALEGSSHYDLPPILRWITGNIGVHHVHHLASRIPFYRLPEVLRDHDALANSNRVTLRESLGCVRLALWDESAGRLVTFAEARGLPT
ncbi:fatty acid desaturase [Ruegeria marina]|uniref:Omega-6 fatty acid desaturase (Delta-12 desaturase) n=1 Tax=Ruegeria marina TaxID=639004 RepID=A0A1G6YAA9_9RHOB|nr:fatty acid desaturase [Ruegeria marina]SDD87434.1 omega-6 fatty acid desaturase (delta-12 desaturase) [Ruegeria marina]